jgi:hypothetical protein
VIYSNLPTAGAESRDLARKVFDGLSECGVAAPAENDVAFWIGVGADGNGTVKLRRVTATERRVECWPAVRPFMRLAIVTLPNGDRYAANQICTCE